jgi:MoxR-like ATPase
MFENVESVRAGLQAAGYLCNVEIATAVFLAARLQKPLLVEGPAGVGKTELGRAVSRATQRELVRMQCYEGLDESKSLYEWAYAKQLLYAELLKEKLKELLADAPSFRESVERLGREDDAFFSDRFLLPRPLLKAIRSAKPVVLLVDEVDKSDAEFESFLLEVLSDFTVTIPELGTLLPTTIPFVVLTSNNAREMSDPLRRRCLHLYIDYPDPARELDIVRLHVPEIAQTLAGALVAAVGRVRKLDLRKAPSISETIDWARALVVLGAEHLDPETAKQTLGALLKYEGDLKRATDAAQSLFVEEPAAEAPTGTGGPTRGGRN